MTQKNNAALTANVRPYDSPLIEGVVLGRKFIIYDEGGHDVEQAEFIAKAINCHDELLEALGDELTYLDNWREALMGASVPDFDGRIKLIASIESRKNEVLSLIAKARG